MTAIGYVTKQADGRYNSHIRAASIRAEIDIPPNIQKASDAITDPRVVAQGNEIGSGQTRRGEPFGKDYVSLSIGAPEFGSMKFQANLDKVGSSEDEDLYAAIWNCGG